MKRILNVAVAVLLLAGSALAAAGTATVVVRKAAVRRDRQHYAPAIAEAKLGDALAVLAREKGWLKVETQAGPGWIHESAVTTKAVAASGRGGAGGAAEERDVAAAGKGFNPQVESAYRKRNPEANYAAVDRMETLGADEAAVAAFAREGNLEPRGAGK